MAMVQEATSSRQDLVLLQALLECYQVSSVSETNCAINRTSELSVNQDMSGSTLMSCAILSMCSSIMTITLCNRRICGEEGPRYQMGAFIER